MKGFPVYIGPAICLVFFMGVGFISANIFHIEGEAFRNLMILMGVLGVSSSAFFYFCQNKIQEKRQVKKDAAAGGGADAGGAAASGKGSSTEIDQLIKDADQRLAASGGATVGNLPLIFVIGDQGTTKTSVIVHSGLDPDLLAAQGCQKNHVVSTRSAHVSVARNCIFAEGRGGPPAQPPAPTRPHQKKPPRQTQA